MQTVYQRKGWRVSLYNSSELKDIKYFKRREQDTIIVSIVIKISSLESSGIALLVCTSGTNMLSTWKALKMGFICFCHLWENVCVICYYSWLYWWLQIIFAKKCRRKYVSCFSNKYQLLDINFLPSISYMY